MNDGFNPGAADPMAVLGEWWTGSKTPAFAAQAQRLGVDPDQAAATLTHWGKSYNDAGSLNKDFKHFAEDFAGVAGLAAGGLALGGALGAPTVAGAASAAPAAGAGAGTPALASALSPSGLPTGAIGGGMGAGTPDAGLATSGGGGGFFSKMFKLLPRGGSGGGRSAGGSPSMTIPFANRMPAPTGFLPINRPKTRQQLLAEELGGGQ